MTRTQHMLVRYVVSFLVLLMGVSFFRLYSRRDELEAKRKTTGGANPVGAVTAATAAELNKKALAFGKQLPEQAKLQNEISSLVRVGEERLGATYNSIKIGAVAPAGGATRQVVDLSFTVPNYESVFNLLGYLESWKGYVSNFSFAKNDKGYSVAVNYVVFTRPN